MATASGPAPVLPNPAIPKTFGILNITFGLFLVLFGICSGLGTILAPMIQQSMNVTPGKVTFGAATNVPAATVKVGVVKPIVALPADGEKQPAADVAKKEPAKPESASPVDADKRDAGSAAPSPAQPAAPTLISAPGPGVPAGMSFDLQELNKSISPVVHYVGWFNLVTGLVLNLLMVISGFGLVALRGWARRLALWVAGAKILRLLVVATLNLAVVVPETVRQQQAAFDKLAEAEVQQAERARKPGGGAAAATPAIFSNPQMRLTMARTAAIFSGAFFVVVPVLGLIYPAVSIWLLTRPQARAACEWAGQELSTGG